MMDELESVQRLRLKLKAAKALIRDLGIAVAQAEEALQAAHDAQPQEGTAHEHTHQRSFSAAA